MSIESQEIRATLTGIATGGVAIAAASAISTAPVAAGVALGVAIWFAASRSLILVSNGFTGRATRGLASSSLIGLALLLRWPLLFGVPVLVARLLDVSMVGFLIGFKVSLMSWAAAHWIVHVRHSDAPVGA